MIDYTREDFSAEGEIYDVVFVAVDKGSFDSCMKVLRPGGIYLNVTVPLPSPRMLWRSRAAGARMALGENPPRGPDGLLAIKALVEAGELRPVIDRSYPLDEIVEAHRYVDRGHKRGNVVIRVALEGPKASAAHPVSPIVEETAA